MNYKEAKRKGYKFISNLKTKNMKKYFTTFILLLFSVAVFSQEIMKNKDYYAAKAKRQRSGGRVMLIGGAALVGGGFLIGNRNESTFDDAATGAVIGALGAGLMIGSIPVFIAAGKNRKKAVAGVSFRLEQTTMVNGTMLGRHQYPALSLRVRW